jgi:hypothetical protein
LIAQIGQSDLDSRTEKLAMDPQDRTLTLPAFLKVLTGNNVPVPKAMAVASKVFVCSISKFV